MMQIIQSEPIAPDQKQRMEESPHSALLQDCTHL